MKKDLENTDTLFIQNTYVDKEYSLANNIIE